MGQNIYGVDIGTSNFKMCCKDKDKIINEKNIIAIANKKINKNLPDVNLEEYSRTDGIITQKENLVLSTTNADCILLLFFDPVTKTIANIHSGWKGTLQRISIKTVQKMVKECECKPEDIICCICPSIRKCHFEVDKDVKDLFEEEFKDVFTCAKHVRENFIDITLKGVTKGDAITELIEKLGIDKKDTYAFGDADNDYDMTLNAGIGVVMANGSEKTKSVADYITDDNDHDGIGNYIEKYIL